MYLHCIHSPYKLYIVYLFNLKLIYVYDLTLKTLRESWFIELIYVNVIKVELLISV